MSLLLVMNPGSRAGRGQRLWDGWRAGLDAAGAVHQCVRTEGPGHARELARKATEHDTVVAVGGDGTINEVLDGVIQSGNRALRMGVLYSGTSPDFCRFHGVPVRPEEALQALLSGRTRQVDVVRIAFHDAAGAEQVAHFGCSCNVGMGARIARQANRWRATMGDALGTGLAVTAALLANRRVDLTLQADSESIVLPAANNLSVVKNPYLASGLKLQLNVGPDNGRMWLVGVSGRTRVGMLALLPGFYSGRVTAAPGLLVRSCDSVTIIASRHQEIEFDGDPRGYLPARIELLPRALALVGGTHD
jgi:diacylglycerol kinase family enzyme